MAHRLKPRKEKIVKPSKITCRFQRSLVLAVMFLTLTWIGQAHTAPTVRPFGGVTSVQLSEAFVGAVSTLNLTPGPVEPGALVGGMAQFPIPGGGLDRETLRGDIFHVGGLSLSNQNGTAVNLFNFIIDTASETAVLTGLVTANDDLVGRIPLFDLDLAQVQVEEAPFGLTISGVTLLLTEPAALALNEALGVDAFMAGFNVGVAEILALLNLSATGDQ